jgi:DHA2 family multidrug resistance protein
MNFEPQKEPFRPAVNPYIIAISVMLSTFMEVLDTTVANVSLPAIAGGLSAGMNEIPWVLSSYLVANAIVLPLAGWVAARVGRKRTYMTCVFIFTVSSFFCAASTSLTMLIICRVIQGIGGGGLQPLSQAILFESFPREKRGMAGAVFGIGVGFAPIIGPTLGGWITDTLSWHWIFYLNLPIGALSLLLVSLFVEDPPYLKPKKIPVDYAGIGFLFIGIGFLQIILDNGERYDWFEARWIVWMAGISAVALVGFIVRELSTPHPIVELSLLRDRNYSASLLLMFTVGCSLYASIMLLPLFLQRLMGYTAMLSGIAISPGGVSSILLMPFIGLLLAKIDARIIVALGMILEGLSVLDMAEFNLQIDLEMAMTPRIIQGAGLAMLFVPLSVTAFSYIPTEKTGQGTGLFNLMRNLGGSFGIALATTMLQRREQFHHSRLGEALTAHSPQVQARLHELVQMLVQKGYDQVLATKKAIGMLAFELDRQATAMAFVDDFRIFGYMAILTAVLVLTMRKARRTATGAIEH